MDIYSSRETVLFRESRPPLALSLEGSASVKRGAVELLRRRVISFLGCEIAAHNAVHIKRQIARWNMKDSVVLPSNRKSPERPYNTTRRLTMIEFNKTEFNPTL